MIYLKYTIQATEIEFLNVWNDVRDQIKFGIELHDSGETEILWKALE
jgi:hypothetical protein